VLETVLALHRECSQLIANKSTGGAGSLVLTLLRQNSLISGKITGNLRNFDPKNRTPVLYTAHSVEEAEAETEIGTGN
jgi:hypothetical protein